MNIAAEAPDWDLRSALQIAPGEWRQRNGHVAHITHQKILEYQSEGKKKHFPIWIGRCVDCETPCTWNINGTYAAVGKHDFDLIAPALFKAINAVVAGRCA